MMRCLAMIGACACTVSPALAQNQLRFAKPVEFPPLEQEELVALALDSDVYAETRLGYPDLRMLDGNQKEVAFLVRQATAKVGRKVEQLWRARDVALQPLEDGGLEIVFQVDLQEHPERPQGIRLMTPLRNFQHHVRVETSADGATWQLLVEDGLIFDYSQFMDVRNTAIELPTGESGPPSWYRITIKDVTQEQELQLLELSRNLSGDEETSRTERLTIKRQPFRIDRIVLWHEEMLMEIVQPQQVGYDVELKSTEQAADAQETRIYLQSRREPLTGLALKTNDRNFSRRARIEVRREEPGKEVWQTVAVDDLSNIEFRSLQRESLAIEMPERREASYRLVIENQDSPPLSVQDIAAHGNAYEIVFMAKPNHEYRLAYGSPSLQAPNLDTAALTASLDEGFTPIVASLGDALKLEVAPEPGQPLIKKLLNSGPFLTAIIAMLVVLLAVGLFRATRDLEDSAKP